MNTSSRSESPPPPGGCPPPFDKGGIGSLRSVFQIRQNPHKTEKTPTGFRQQEIFSEKSGHGVQLQGHAALLAGSVILVQNTLDNSLVNSLDSNLVSSLSNGLVAGLQSSVELLQVGLQLGLVGLVLLVSDLGRNDILLRGLNVGHGLHLLFHRTLPDTIALYAETHYNVPLP